MREPIDPAAIVLGAPWTSLRVVDTTPSTNTDLLAGGGAPHGTVLVAEHQTIGRGRLNRTWTSPPRAGLTFSVLVRPAVPVAARSWLPLLAGVALCEAMRSVAGVAASLKWPNDLMVDGLKVAGILAQADTDAVVIGCGLNVTTTRDELPVPSATSLELAGARSTDRAELLGAVLAEFGARYDRWVEADGDAEASGLAGEYRARCETIGQDVTVTGTHELTGTAVGVDSVGRLSVRTDGTTVAVAAGDVQHIRPPG